MPMPKQLSLIKDPRKNTKLWWIVKRSTYGGSLNYRKVRRPFDSKMLTHAVFKAQLGKEIRFSKFEATVRQILLASAKRYGVKVTDSAIHHDHIHVLFYTKSREGYSRFLRFFSAEMGRRYAKLYRRMNWKKRKLWVARPFTRLVSWAKRNLKQVRQYIRKNRWETLGFIAYKPRHHSLTRFLDRWAEQRVLSSA